MMQGKYQFIRERREWMGVVFEGPVVLTVGCEHTEAEIKQWLQDAMRVKPWISGNPVVPDMYDRAKKQ